ncbi:hypothetical protein PENCOP_c005G06228 [Penicillium coprophilum]|uniref:Uncharacterized protein n=1 Tax=Penicillium coprophilum TaxID=36646 RepID=A0A1V6URY3_9EURO|nr:hypothetical protein PENCOP_c005G06228 [Penicillium coprophilum]
MRSTGTGVATSLNPVKGSSSLLSFPAFISGVLSVAGSESFLGPQK